MSDSGKKVAVVLANNYEDIEFTSPAEALRNAGAELTIIGTEKGEIKGKKGDTQQADKTFDEVSADEFDMLLIPGVAPRRISASMTAQSSSRRTSLRPASRSVPSATAPSC